MTYHPGVGDFIPNIPDTSSFHLSSIRNAGPAISTAVTIAVPIVIAGAASSSYGRRLNVTARRVLQSSAPGVARGFTRAPVTQTASPPQVRDNRLGSTAVTASPRASSIQTVTSSAITAETSQSIGRTEVFGLSMAEKVGASLRRAVGKAKPLAFMKAPIDIDERTPGSVLSNVRRQALKALERSGAEQLPADFHQQMVSQYGGSAYIDSLIVRECRDAEVAIRSFRIDQLAAATVTFKRAANQFPYATTVLMGALLIGLSIYESSSKDKGTLQIAARMINKEIEANKNQAEADQVAFREKAGAEKVALREAFERLNSQVEKLPPELQSEIRASIAQLQSDMSDYQAQGEAIILQRLEELRTLEPIADIEAHVPKREMGAVGAALSSLVLGLNVGQTRMIAAVLRYLNQVGVPNKVAKAAVTGTLQVTVEEMLRSATAGTVTKEQVNHYCKPILERLGIDPNQTQTPEEARFSQELAHVINRMMSKIGAAYISHSVSTAGVSTAIEAVISETTEQVSHAGLGAAASSTPIVERHLTSHEVEEGVQEFLQPINRRISDFRREYIEGYGAKVEARLARVQAVENMVQAKLRAIADEQRAPTSDPITDVSIRTSEVAFNTLASAATAS